MTEISIPVFPDGSAASTVTTTVWVGVLLVVWCNLRFGWCLSGLVVPGYLVPLMLVRPASVAVMIFEAVITYLIVYALSEWFKNARWWSSFFGRDRFFALVATSVLVRVVCDGYAFPYLGNLANETFGWNFNYHDQLHSVGLVVVALIANYFWKPGLRGGCGPLAATIFVTYILVRYALIPYTTFDIASLRYVYEDIASSLLASPKAYMILLTTAYLASHMNLRFSWEYNGILIPALTALLWCEPTKIAVSFAEAIIVLVVASGILKLPMFKRVNMQGGRKIALFFTVAFLYRLALSWAASLLTPDFKITDLYGFGYLLSTLLAARFHERGHIIRTTVATVSVSFGGALAGSLLGFLFLYVPDPLQGASSGEHDSVRAFTGSTLVDTIRADKVRLYEQQSEPRTGAIQSSEISRFCQTVRDLILLAEQGDVKDASHLQRRFQSVGFELRILEGKFAYLRETTNSRGSGLYVLNLQALDGVVISVPHPLREPYCLEAGVCLFRDLRASVLAVAGVTPVTSYQPDVLIETTHRRLFSEVHRRLGKRRTIQVRGYQDGGVIRPDVGEVAGDDATSSLWISGGLPEGSDLQSLQNLIGKFDVHWDDTPTQNIERDLTQPGFAEVYLSLRTRSALFSQLVVQRQDVDTGVSNSSGREGRILQWLLAQKETIALAGSEAYQPAQLEELLMIDQEVLKPLLELIEEEPNRAERKRQLRLINASAVALGYQVTPFHDPHRDQRFLILEEVVPRRRNWGTYVFAERARSPFFWHVPRPLVELNAYEFAAESFVHSGSVCLLIPGAHLRANRDGSADVARMSSKLTLFNLVHQALLRTYNNQPSMVVQARAMKDPVEADVVFATDSGAESLDELTPLKLSLAAEIRTDDLTVAFVDGSPEYAGYEIGNTAQWDSMRHSAGIEFVSAWLSPTLRWQYRQQSANRLLLSQLATLGTATRELDVAAYLRDELPKYADLKPGLSTILQSQILAYLHSRDIVALQRLVENAAVQQIEQLTDIESQQAFLLIRNDDYFPVVVNLADLRPEGPVRFEWDPASPNHQRIPRAFVDFRATFLVRKEDSR